jgi:phosphopantetheinyl transferase (holo-ACP synthase)
MVSGFVEKFAEVNPSFAKLKGTAGQTIETHVTITSAEKYPFCIVNVSAKKGDNIRFAIKENHSKGWNQYILMVKNIKNKKGWYVDKIYLKTDSTIHPVIEVAVVGIIS